MANYQETSVSGTEYTRCRKIEIINPLGEVPSVRFSEERVTVLLNKVLFDSLPNEMVIPFDASKSFSVLDPTTGASTGVTSTWGDIYALIYSAYIAEATERDNG